MSNGWADLFDRAASYEVDLEAVLSGYEESESERVEQDGEENRDSTEGSDRA